LGNLSHDVGVEQIMKFGEYIRERKRIFNIQDANIECMNLLWGSNSLGGEVGEFQNMVKKIYRDHGSKIPDALKKEMYLELGDQFWYFIFIFDIIESNPMLVLGSKYTSNTTTIITANMPNRKILDNLQSYHTLT